jgi:hypothetical protein
MLYVYLLQSEASAGQCYVGVTCFALRACIGAGA